MSDSHLTPQQQTILQMLKDAGLEGINSYKKARDVALQLPYVIKRLKEKGYSIRSIPQKNKSVQYVLMHSTPLTTPSELTTPSQSRALVYDSVEGTARELTLEQIEAMLADLRMQYVRASAHHRFDIRKRADNYVEAKKELLKQQPVQAIQAP